LRENGDNVRSFSGAADYLYSAATTPDGRIVIAGGQDSTLRVWNGVDGKGIANFTPPAAK
jgi:WD40 repeat protein